MGQLWMYQGWASLEGGKKLQYSFSIFVSELEEMRHTSKNLKGGLGVLGSERGKGREQCNQNVSS